MYARHLIFRNIDIEKGRAFVDWMEEVALPAAKNLNQFEAAVVLFSQEHRSVAVTTIFSTYEAVKAAEPSFADTALSMPADLKKATDSWLESAEIMRVAIGEVSHLAFETRLRHHEWCRDDLGIV